MDGKRLLGVRRCQCRHLYSLSLLLLTVCLYMVVVSLYELRLMQAELASSHQPQAELVYRAPPPPEPPPPALVDDRPIVWVHTGNHDLEGFHHIFKVFDRIGYAHGGASSKWDVLWSHDYPFHSLGHYLGDLRPHQRVNHFPGSGYLTKKVSLVSTDSKIIPKAFAMPHEKRSFLHYAQKNPEKMWVQKSNQHRGVHVLAINELDLVKPETFVQEYIADPYLIDGRRFDIGLYVTITSINPLRAYIHQGEWLVRFCTVDYHPFNASEVKKYVVSDDYTQLWELPSLARLYTELDLTRKQSLFAYLRSKGSDPEKLAKNLEKGIREILFAKEEALIDATRNYPIRNFYEMVRFDFVLDKELNVYLMEVNMSPNLSSAHFSTNKLMYEQVIFGLLSLVGIASAVGSQPNSQTGDSVAMQVSSRDLRVYAELCSSDCQNSCAPQCSLCKECVSAEFEAVLTAAYAEHMHRTTLRRLVPEPFLTQEAAKNWNATNDSTFLNFTAANRKMFLWFRGKCLLDAAWCV